jgi:hypothetical protein
MLIDCFSYKIFKTNLNFLYREKFINIIENLPCDKVLEGANSTTTNGKILDIIYDDIRFKKDNINFINDLCYLIENKLHLFSKQINLNKELEISNLWCVSYKDTEKCVPHRHSNDKNYCFSGIYYLSFDSNEHQATTFYNDESLSESLTPNCDEDDLLIYPADIWHGYEGIVSSKRRIVIPFDVKVKSNIKYY